MDNSDGASEVIPGPVVALGPSLHEPGQSLQAHISFNETRQASLRRF